MTRTPEGVSETVFFREQADRIENSNLLVRPQRPGYFPNETIDRNLFDIRGETLGKNRFAIKQSVGSGFAGEVYKGFPDHGIIYSRYEPPIDSPVAIKVLRPRSKAKEQFRDFLFKLSFQAPFAPRLREESLRVGLIWQQLLRIGAKIEFGDESLIVLPIGYFYDEKQRSFVEVHQWEDGRPARYKDDDQIIQRTAKRLAGRKTISPDSEIQRKRITMNSFVLLCRKMGANGVALQHEWFSFVSQPNSLTRNNNKPGLSETVGIDWRPGLAFPFFLPLTPAHLKVIIQGLKRKHFAHFDEVDFAALDAFIRENKEVFRDSRDLVDQLKTDDRIYRESVLDIFHTRTRVLIDSRFRYSLRVGMANDWFRLGKVSETEVPTVIQKPEKYLGYLILDNIPFIGQRLLRFVGNEKYRQHLKKIFTSPECFKEFMTVRKAQDLFEWVKNERVSLVRGELLNQSAPKYLLEKFLLSWMPSGIHRFLVDGQAREEVLNNLVIKPYKLFTDRNYRTQWLLEILDYQADRLEINPSQLAILKMEAGDKRIQNYIRDIGFAVLAETSTKILYPVLAAYGVASGDLLPLGIAALFPISPAGVLRTLYVLAQLGSEIKQIVINKDTKLFLSRFLGVLFAPWRVIGNVFVPTQMFIYYNDMSLVLADYFSSKLVDKIPIFGGKGQLLDYLIFNLTYNVPLSARRILSNSLEPIKRRVWPK